MRLHSVSVSRRIFSILNQRYFATAPTSSQENVKPLIPYRTVSDPGSFTTRNIGQWYTVPVAHLEKLSYKVSLPEYYVAQVDTLLECSVMVRRPLVDVVNCLRHMNPDVPIIRYVIFGAHGTGKSMTLWQTVQWALSSGWILCYVPLARVWNRKFTEIAQSTYRPERFDMPIRATEWLALFKSINEDLINQHKLVTSTKEYTWTARENTPLGSPLMSLVELGISRPKIASDCMGALLRELKHHAKGKKAKVMVAVDGINSFFVTSRFRRPDGTYMHTSEISLMHHLTKLCKSDWNNGAFVTTVDNQELARDKYETKPPWFPYYLLGQEGFDAMDPFVPIRTTEYTDHEANSCLDYYIEKNWIQRPNAKTEQGRKEIIHISAKNPLLLERAIAAY